MENPLFFINTNKTPSLRDMTIFVCQAKHNIILCTKVVFCHSRCTQFWFNPAVLSSLLLTLSKHVLGFDSDEQLLLRFVLYVPKV